MKNMTNRVSLIGVLGKDPELFEFESGKKKASFSLATSTTYKNGKGERVESTEWHRISIWGKNAENASNLLAKGRKIALEGHLRTSSFEDKDGKTCYVTEVVGEEFLILSPKKKGEKAN